MHLAIPNQDLTPKNHFFLKKEKLAVQGKGSEFQHSKNGTPKYCPGLLKPIKRHTLPSSCSELQVTFPKIIAEKSFFNLLLLGFFFLHHFPATKSKGWGWFQQNITRKDCFNMLTFGLVVGIEVELYDRTLHQRNTRSRTSWVLHRWYITNKMKIMTVDFIKINYKVAQLIFILPMPWEEGYMN